MHDEQTAAAPLLRSEPRILLVSPHPASPALVDTPLAAQRALAQLAAMEVSTVLDAPAGTAGRAERGHAVLAPAEAGTDAGEGPARFPQLTPDSVQGWLQQAGYPPAR